MRRKRFSVSRNVTAAHRTAIALVPPATHPIRVCWRTPACDEPMMLVVVRQRRSAFGRPKRLTVNISERPSRRLAAADGHSGSSHDAYRSSFRMPSSASSLHARSVARACSRYSFGRWPSRLRSLWLRHRCTRFDDPNTRPMALRSALAPWITNRRRRPARSPRASRSSSRPTTASTVLRRAAAQPQHVLPAVGIHAHRRQHVVVAEHDPVEVDHQHVQVAQVPTAAPRRRWRVARSNRLHGERDGINSPSHRDV